MDCCRNIGSDEYLHGAMAGKAGGNTIYNVRCHCVGILFLQVPKHLKGVFYTSLFHNFHALSYLIADSIYQCTVESIFRGLDVLSEEYIFRVYLGMAIGMGILLLSYTLVLLIMTGVVIKIVKKPFMLRWQEIYYSFSVLNRREYDCSQRSLS